MGIVKNGNSINNIVNNGNRLKSIYKNGENIWKRNSIPIELKDSIFYFNFENEVKNIIPNGIQPLGNYPTVFVNGMVDKAIQFSGNNEFLYYHNSYTTLQDFSIGLWMETNNPLKSCGLIGQSVAGAIENRFSISMYQNNLYFHIGKNPDVVIPLSSPDNWNHIIMSRKDGTVSIFINGELKLTFSKNSIINPYTLFYIGCYGDRNGNPSAFYEGEMSEAFFIDKGLTEIEVKNIYNFR